MSWFPNFLNWQGAALAAALAIPALLVLYFLKLRRREMPVSSTILWKKAIQDLQVNAPFQRLRRNLLLLLQLLILLFLILALAKPVSNVTPTPGNTTVILIDRSASMSAKTADGGTRLDEAKRRARELVAAMGRGATAMVIAFDDNAETMQTFTSDANLLRQAIDRVGPTDRKSRLKLAYQLAEAQLFFIPEQNRSNITPPDVRVFSDGRVLDADELSIKAPVTLEKVGDEQTRNIAIVALSAKRNYERPTQVQIFARLANFGPEPAGSRVELSVDGKRVQAEAREGTPDQVFLLPERWTDKEREEYRRVEGNRKPSESVEFELDLTESAVIRVEQTNKEGDALAADDVAQVVVPPPKQLAVLLVTDGNYYLEKLIQSQKHLDKPDVMFPLAYEENKPTKYDVYVFDRYRPQVLPPAGSFIHIAAVPEGLKVKAVKDARGVNQMLDYSEDLTAVLDWKRDHPILRGMSLAKLGITQSLKLEVPLDSEVLVDGMRGPLIALHREGKGTHMFIAFDVVDSTWPLSPTFPYFMYNTLQFLAVGSEMDVRQSFDPGATPRIPAPNLRRGAEQVRQVALIDPAGESRTLKVPETGDFALPSLERVGIYRTEPPVPQYEQIAVNLLDANESDLVPATAAPGGKPTDVREASGKVRRDLWRYLVMAGIAMLFVEWWVYTRRVHL
jgi:uncharacterized protein YegL